MKTVKIQNLKAGSKFNFNVKSMEGIYVQTDPSMSHKRIDSAFRLHGPKAEAGHQALNETVFTVVRNGLTCMRVQFQSYNAKKGRWQQSEATIRTDRIPEGTKIVKA
ncbi:MAG: hypothetical protein WCP55_16155 [Lentisphaerota bacterium]